MKHNPSPAICALERVVWYLQANWGHCIEGFGSSARVLPLTVLKGSGTSTVNPLSRWAKLNCFSSLLMKLNTLRQLCTFKFLPNSLELHAILSTFPDEEVLPDDARMFAGDTKSKDEVGFAARSPMLSGCCGRLAVRILFE